MFLNSKLKTPKKSGFLAIATGALALVAVSGTANSALLTGTSTPNQYIDGATYVDTINLTGGTTVTGVTLTVDFTKCSSPLSSSTCTTSGNPFNNEIMMKLEHGSTIIDLIVFYTFDVTNPGQGQRAVVTFDDTASDVIGTTNSMVPEDGDFQPIGSLASFIGDTAAGDWKLIAIDNDLQDPLWLTSWTINVETDEPIVTPPPPPPPPTAVSEPGTLAILGLGIVGLGIARRKRKA
jgi:hypothetical protein